MNYNRLPWSYIIIMYDHCMDMFFLNLARALNGFKQRLAVIKWDLTQVYLAPNIVSLTTELEDSRKIYNSIK